jgi:hypothetical protein
LGFLGVLLVHSSSCASVGQVSSNFRLFLEASKPVAFPTRFTTNFSARTHLDEKMDNPEVDLLHDNLLSQLRE